MLRRLSLLCLAAGMLVACGSTDPAPNAVAEEPAAAPPAVDSATRAARAIAPGYKIGRPYRVAGRLYHPKERFSLVQRGEASWYGPGFHGRTTANGERYDMHALTAAHRTLQMPSVVRVTNLDNGKSVIVRINDRGPYIDGRIVDLSRKGAEAIGLVKHGVAPVRLVVLADESRKVGEMARAKASVGQLEDYIAGLNADLVHAPLPRRPVQLATAGGGSGRLFLQAAAFTDRKYADRARSMLRGIGPVEITPVQRGDRTLYRVRVGPYREHGQAANALERIREVGFEGAHLVAHG